MIITGTYGYSGTIHVNGGSAGSGGTSQTVAPTAGTAGTIFIYQLTGYA